MEKKSLKSFISSRLGEIIAAAVLLLAMAWFAFWGFSARTLSVQGVITAALELGMLAVGVVIAVPRALNFFRGLPELSSVSRGERSLRPGRLPAEIGIVLMTMLLRALLILAAYAVSTLTRGFHGTVFATLEDIWLKSDTEAQSILAIAENGYSVTANTLTAPLFPLMVRGVSYFLGSGFLSAMLINTVLTCAFSAVVYRLALCDIGRRSSRTAVLFTLAMPAAIFFAAPTSDALFLLLTASALLALRKEKFIIAGIFAALASFSRIWGIIIIVPYLAEAAAFFVREQRDRGVNGLASRIVRVSLGFVLALLGGFAYVLADRLAYGQWFRFLGFAANVKAQKPAPFMTAAVYQIDELFSTIGRNNSTALALWVPNLLFVFGALAVFVASARTLHTSYSLYFAAYFISACGFEGLAAAPRYLTALAVLPLALALLCESRDDGEGIMRSRAKTAAVLAVLAVGQIFYLIMYVLKYKIY